MPAPSDILSGISLVLDPANVVLVGSKISQFNGPVTISQPTDSERAVYEARDPHFNGQPTATFSGAQRYSLGNLSSYTAAECFAVVKLAADPPATTSVTLARFGAAPDVSQYPATFSTVYDGFFSTTIQNCGDIAANLAQPHIYNPRSRAGEWTLEVNGVQRFTTATNTVGGATGAWFGFDQWFSTLWFSGKLAYLCVCNQVQTTAARAAMNAYLKARFGMVVASDYTSLLGSNLRAFWHQGEGVIKNGSTTSVIQWNDVVSGRVAPLTGGGAAPAYALDGSPGQFFEKPVVQLAAGGQYLQTAIAEIVAAGARPYVFSVHRLRASASWADVWSLNDTDNMSLYMGASGGNVIFQFKQPGDVTVTPGAQDTAPHFDEAWLDGTFARARRESVEYRSAATGAITPAINRVRMGNGQGAVSMFCLGVCAALPTIDQLEALAALIAADVYNVHHLTQGVLTEYLARDINASASSWTGALGHVLPAVGTTTYKKDGYNFGACRVPGTTSSASFRGSASVEYVLYAEYSGYVMVVGRFAELGATDGTLIDFGSGTRIYYDASERTIKGVWQNVEIVFGRADTEQHVFELNFESYGSTGPLYAYLDGVSVGGFVEAPVMWADSTRFSIGAMLDGSEGIATRVSRVITQGEVAVDYTRSRLRWMLTRLDRITSSLEKILGANLREVFYAKDAALVGEEVSSVTGKLLSTSITPPSSVTRPAYRYYDSALRSAAIDCTRAGRYLRNFALSATVLPSGSRPFVFVIGRLRTAPGASQTFFAAARRASADYDICIGMSSGASGQWWFRFYNAMISRNSYGPTNDLNPHILGSYVDASTGSALWYDGATYNAQATGTAAVSAAIDSIAVGANGVGTETEDWTFAAYGLCANHPTTQELAALYTYYRVKYLDIDGVTHNVAAGSDTAVVTDQVRRGMVFGRRISDAVASTDQVRRLMTYGRRQNDTAVVTDQARRLLAYLRRPSDTATVSDQARRLMTYGRRQNDTAVVTDQARRLFTFGRVQSDTAVVTEQIRRATDSVRRLTTDAVVVTDSTSVSVVRERRLNDTAVVTDQTSCHFTYGRSQNDTAVVADQIRRTADSARRLTTDAVVATDSARVAVVYGRRQSDAAVVSDQALRSTALARSHSDTASATDQARNENAFLRARTDAVAATDSVSLAAVYGRRANDTTSTSDGLAPLVLRSLSDATSVADSLVHALTSSRALTTIDNVSVLDTVRIERAIAVSIADAVTSFDAVSRPLQIERATSDAIAQVTESLRVMRNSVREVSEAVSAIDQLGVEVSTVENDAIGVADSLLVARVIAVQPISDAAALVDALLAARELNAVMGDSVATMDAQSVSLAYARASDDEIAALDTVERSLPTLSFNDALFVSDALQVATSHAVRTFDALAVDESLLAAQVWARTINDSIATTDSHELDRSMRVAISDAVTTTDAIASVQRVLERTFTQALSITDELRPTYSVTYSLRDDVSVSEHLVRAHEAVRSQLDELTTVDDLAMVRNIRIDVRDSVDVDDTPQRITFFRKQLFDVLGVAERLVVSREADVLLDDAIGLEDSIARAVARPVLHLRLSGSGSANHGPLFLSAFEPGPLVLSSGDARPVGVVVRFGDLVSIADSIQVEI